ncbi:uncharacterized protein C8R40DRAFT_1095931 [Lentinula edodes]|uniref:uncharacterized protein n=1 Tax=Lentinula edodes TaxID=5353 RepID=UPI001E8EED81|nr:uncharacterized protein C8R40DRAFT_1095931 [Lentinula edodes]KAH7877401.1 hypothetical protein C8R40DRAFT_1095931 [Lentinula edodes]
MGVQSCPVSHFSINQDLSRFLFVNYSEQSRLDTTLNCESLYLYRDCFTTFELRLCKIMQLYYFVALAAFVAAVSATSVSNLQRCITDPGNCPNLDNYPPDGGADTYNLEQPCSRIRLNYGVSPIQHQYFAVATLLEQRLDMAHI